MTNIKLSSQCGRINLLLARIFIVYQGNCPDIKTVRCLKKEKMCKCFKKA